MNRLENRIVNFIHRFYPQFGFRQSDILLASFPRSGNTWVRLMLAHTMCEYTGKDVSVDFSTIANLVPEIPPTAGLPRQSLFEGFPRVIKTHERFVNRSTCSIYILRHPADVMVSYYHYLRGRWNKNLGEFSGFIKNPEYGVPAWAEHVKSWEGNWDILVRFEDLKQDPLAQLRKMISLFDKDIKNEILEAAVKKSSFENMKMIEEKSGLPYKKGANPNYTFVRKGEYRKGKELFKNREYKYLNKVAREILQRYGYE